MPTLTTERLVDIIRTTWLAVFGRQALDLGGDVRVDNAGQPDESIEWAGWSLMRGQIPGTEDRWYLFHGVTSGGSWHGPPDYDMVEAGSGNNPLWALNLAVTLEACEISDNVILGVLEAIDLQEADAIDAAEAL